MVRICGSNSRRLLRMCGPFSAPNATVRGTQAGVANLAIPGAATLKLSIEEVLSASRSPWQNPFVERLIGSIRRECLDHIITSTSVTCGTSCRAIFNIITGPEPISRSTRIVHSPAPSSLPLQARLSPSRRWAVCIIATNVALPDLRGQRNDAPRST